MAQDTNAEVVYTADGRITCERDGDEYIVESKGREPSTQWTKRVPAIRTAAVPGERLWVLPANWQPLVGYHSSDARYLFVNIPESEYVAKVSVPTNNALIDAWYGVEAVGTFDVVLADFSDKTGLENLSLTRLHDEVDEVLDDLTRPTTWYRFTRNYKEAFEPYALDTFEESFKLYEDDGYFFLDSLPANPWVDSNNEIETALEASGFDEYDRAVLEEVGNRLVDEGIIHRTPSLQPVLHSDEVADREYLIALTERGGTPAEALDYLMVEIHDWAQTEWGDKRGRSNSTVSRNVKSMRHKLLD
jgi:hypothetical protein